MSVLPGRCYDVRSDETRVTCRPGYRALILALVYLLLAAFVADLARSDARTAVDYLTGAMTAVGFAGFGLAAAYRALWPRVRVDENGVAWRTLFHRAHFVPWDAVSDYYLRQRSALKEEAVIETGAGVILVGADWRGLDALKEVVCRRATASRAHGWGFLGTRSGDTERVFSYDTPANRRDAYVIPIAVTLGDAVTFFLLGWAAAGIVAWRWAPQPAVMFVALLAALAGILLVGISLSLVALSRDTARRRRRNERIATSPVGVRFHSDTGGVFARWEDVTGCDRDSLPDAPLGIPRYVVHTRNGDFDFLATLDGHFVLKKWIAALLPDDAVPWRETGAENLRVDPRRWPGGGHLFHYRTRSNLALVIFAAVMGGLSVFLHIEKGGGEALVAIFGFAAAWLAWRFWSAAIRVEEHGITHFGPFGQRFLPWEAVRTLHLNDGKRDGLSRETVRGADGTIAFWDVIADVEGLRAEIRRHVPKV